MTQSSSFAAFAGGVIGREHRRALRDGQDGAAVVQTEAVVAAIVTDGCSSGRESEVGARLGAAWLADLIASTFPGRDPLVAARDVTRALVERLDGLARSRGPGR